MADVKDRPLMVKMRFVHRIESESGVSTVTELKGKKTVSKSVRAYVLLHLSQGDPQQVAQSLRHKLGVLMADSLEGPPDVIVVVEAPGRQELAELTVQALSSVENMIENVRLLPIHDEFHA